MMYIDLTGSDWHTFFYPHAAHLAGLYDGVQHYPPWLFVLLWPLALLPVTMGYLALNAVSFVVVVRYVKTWWRVVLLAASAPVLVVLAFCNLDIILSAVFFLPLSIALILVAGKPQALAGWMVRRLLHRWPGILVFVPLILVVLISFTIWGWWPAHLAADHLADGYSIAHLWPWTIVPGLLLLATRNPTLWLVGSAMLSPYMQLYHLTPLLVYVYARGRPLALVIVTILSWVVALALVS